ncbi:MAG: cadherin-like beta sandwich domain-containing protein [Ferruginibacter sp.]
MHHFTPKFLLSFFMGMIVLTGNAQIAAWDFTGENAVASSTAEVYNVNLDAPNLLTRGAGAAASAGANSFRTVGFQNNGISTANTDYFQFTLSSNTGYLLSLSSLDARFAGTATYYAGAGVTSQFAYSLDGTNFTLIGNPVTSPSLTLSQINLSGVAALQNVPATATVTIRYYASGQTATGGWGFFSSAPGIYGLAVGGNLTSSVSNNADLSNLTLSSGLLSPTFTSNTTSYTASVANSVSSLTVTPTSSQASATITVNGIAVTSGSPSGSISLNVGTNTITTVVTAEDGITTKTYTVTVTRAAAGTPVIVTTSPLADFGAVCINTPVGPNSFVLDGSDLDGSNVTVGALSGFTYSETSGGTYTNTLSFSYAGSSFTGKTIYVKFTPTAVQSYNGNIDISGGGVGSYSISATGSGVNTLNTVTTGGSSSITATTAVVSGSVATDGCATVTSYGFEYSTNSGFLNGTGTVVTANNLNAGNFSATISNLIPNTRYYYKAFAISASGTSYGVQQAFTNTPLPVVLASQPGLTFTETFADIANWSNFFITGMGANHFDGLSATGSGGIPNGTTLTASTQSFTTGTSGGVQKGTTQIVPTESIVLLSTGATNNTTSAALDFYMDFTGVNAGTLSFDWASVNNSTGDRNGSLRVYTSIDGVAFTELIFASVLDFTNNAPTTGSKTNIALPSTFNNNPNARLRFYYHNGTGGTTGSRPKISIDNLTVTAVATTPCVSPTASATSLTFGTITDVSIQGSFSASNPTSDGYIIVMSTNSSLTGAPVNGQLYANGDNIGDGTVIANGSATTFNATGLNALTTYYFFVYPVNSICTGGPLYYTTNVLNGSATTVAGLPNCVAPSSQPGNLVFGTTTTNSIQGTFTATTANEYLVVRSSSSILSATPLDGQVYTAGDILGNGIVVSRNSNTSFNTTELTPNTAYYFFIFSLNSQNCVNGPAYNVTAPLTGTQTTAPLPPCVAPSAQPTNLNLTASNTTVSGTFTGVVDADNYLIVRSTTSTLSATPTDNVNYAAGDNFGGGIIIENRSNTSFLSTGLTTNTTYFFFVFASNNNCSGGIKYTTSAALSGSVLTANSLVNNYYFGTLHAHSDYSDGNQDNPGFTPTQDYAYAKTALCMDYLGISEHNHFSSPNNPGNLLVNYHSGTAEANTFTSANPSFLALYGMEWGVISGGGHVLIYGDGMDNLWGWETGAGPWGATSNYDVFVPKNTYTGTTGLFKTVNDNLGTNTFASLAHPNLTDFNNIANLPYDAVADAAIVSTAIESGPAFSTNTTYSNPAFPLSYLYYYQTLLSKGYKLGPSIDHDNHNTTFGKTTYSRTAIVAPALTKTAIISAMRNMSFYSTHDCDSKVDFTINTRIMGSSFFDRFAPNISVVLTDATTSTATAVIRVMFGIPGSGITPIKIDSAIGNTLSFSDVNLTNGETGYYYIDISNGSSRIITSPIWYTRTDNITLPIKLRSFYVQKMDNNTAKILWTTEQEINSSHFVIERSSNGSTWNNIGSINAAGNSSNRKYYTTFDNAPMQGINSYRFKMVDLDGSYEYSEIRKVAFNSFYTAQVAPNPANDVINIYISKSGSQNANIELINLEGKVIYKTSSSQSHIPIATQGMSKGLYFVKIIEVNKVTTIRVMLQ